MQRSMADSTCLQLYNKKYIEINQRTVSPDDELLEYFENLGFIKDLRIDQMVEFSFSTYLSKQYLTTYGIWLELFVYMEACKLNGVSDVRLGAMIDWDAEDGIEKVGNEIDIILSKNSRPISISCKFTEPDIAAINEILINTRRIGGNKGKGILVAFCDMKRAYTGAFQRAKELGIRVLDKEDILSGNFTERLQREIDLGDSRD